MSNSGPNSTRPGGQVTGEIGPSEQEMAEMAALALEARKLFSGRVEFLLSAPKLEFLPPDDFPEVAFCGRSNVGKSTLINALVGRKAIARTSVTPGRTQELNFFEIGQPTEFRLVDMPGYGFAKAPVKVVEKWKNLVKTFLRGRAVLKRNLVLIDSRRGIGQADEEMMVMLDEAAVGYRIVITKADKIKASELAKVREQANAAARKHPAAFPFVHCTSAEKGMGLDELRAAILTDIRN